MAMLAVLLATVPPEVLPLLETNSEQIELISVETTTKLPEWSAEIPHSITDNPSPSLLRIVRTKRLSLDGSGSWQVVYGIDCTSRRVRRLSQPMESDLVGFAKQKPLKGENGFWYPERPFTLSSQLLKRVCPSPN